MQTMQWACEPCRSSKRKCDRVIPACGRCTRTSRICYYDLQRVSGKLTQWSSTSTPDRTIPSCVATLSSELRTICPIPFRWYMPRLLQHYHESLESSRVESDSKSTAYKLQSVWFQHALYDRCLFHVTLYIGSSYLDIRTGETPSTLTLYHQNEVIRSVNERLSDPGEALEDCTIATVALLALFSSLGNDQAASQVHTAGLRRLINLKGGHSGLGPGLDGLLATLIHMNDVVQSIVFGSLGSDQHLLLPQGYHVVPPLGLESRILEYRALPYRLIDSFEHSSSMSRTLSDATTNLFREIYAFKIEICRVGNSAARIRNFIFRGYEQMHTPSSLISDDDPIHCCCVLGASIFWLAMHAHYLSDTSTKAASKEPLADKLDRMTRQLKSALSLLESTAWLESSPIAYCWVCMVGAALSRETSMRVWFWVRQAAVLRILNAVDDFGFLDELLMHVVWLRGLAGIS